MIAPTDTPRVDRLMDSLVSEDGAIPLENAGEIEVFARTLERELAAARAEADELARRVAEGVWYWHASTVHPVPTKDIEESIARVRAEMEKERAK